MAFIQITSITHQFNWTHAEAVCYFRQGIGWHEKPAFQRSKPTIPVGQSAWKLWMPGFQKCGNWNDPDFGFFADNFPAFKPHLVERFADSETGIISPDFIMAVWLGQVAKDRASLASRAYVYYPEKMVLRVMLLMVLCVL